MLFYLVQGITKSSHAEVKLALISFILSIPIHFKMILPSLQFGQDKMCIAFFHSDSNSLPVTLLQKEPLLSEYVSYSLSYLCR